MKLRAGPLLAVLLAFATNATVHARPLSEVELFYRCYAHLTQTRLPAESGLLAEVRSGQKTAIAACTEVLDSARFMGATGAIADSSNAQSKLVLSTMHHLHQSWSRNRDLTISDGNSSVIGTQTWFEDAPMADYITRALFDPRYDVRSITQGTDFLTPIRSSTNVARSYSGVPSAGNTDWRLGSLHPFAMVGELLGIQIASPNVIQWSRMGPVNGIPDFPSFLVAPIVEPSDTGTLSTVNLIDLAAVRGSLSETVQFGVWITGKLVVPVAGSYTLYIDVQDGAALYINGVRVINKSADGTNTEGSVVLNLNAGQVPLEIRYRKGGNPLTGKLIFSWSSQSIVKQVVPAENLLGPSGEEDLLIRRYLNGKPQTIDLTGHRGGGFLGNYNYLATTYSETDAAYVPNGQELTNRSWAKAVISDALCREIPVVRETDALPFVDPDSPTPFRHQAGCVTCHVTSDRMAGLIRNIRWNNLRSVQNDPPVPDWFGFLNFTFRVPDVVEDATWPAQLDSSYARRAVHGRLFLRTHSGQLVDTQVRSFEELGRAIRETEDHYICFARRYYRYLTGINVPLGDPGNPSYSTPNAVDAWHLARVKEFGLQLQQNGSLRQLIISIMSSPQYRMSDYGIRYSG